VLSELTPPRSDPPMLWHLLKRLIDTDSNTCLDLAHANYYTFVASDSHWVPKPQDNCWLEGLVFKVDVPNEIKTAFSVEITGHQLVCAESRFSVNVNRQKRNTAGCAIAGEYDLCKFSGPAVSGENDLVTCAASCLCDGNDCSHVTIEIPGKYDGWKICEITLISQWAVGSLALVVKTQTQHKVKKVMSLFG